MWLNIDKIEFYDIIEFCDNIEFMLITHICMYYAIFFMYFAVSCFVTRPNAFFSHSKKS